MGLTNLISAVGRKISGALVRSGWSDFARFFSQYGEGSERPRHPYRQLVAVFNCVTLKTRLLSQMPFTIFDAGDNVIESGPLFDCLNSPGPGLSSEELWEQTYGWRDLTGRAHWIVRRQGTRYPTGFTICGAPQMRPEWDRSTGQLKHWLFRPAGASVEAEEQIDPQAVRTFRYETYDAADPYGGQAVVAVAQRAINQVYMAMLANEASLANGAEPSSLMSLDGASEDQRKQVEAVINERCKGVLNRNRMVFLTGAHVEKIGASFTDMQLAELLVFNESAICRAFGVDPAAVGIFQKVSDARSQTQSAKDSVLLDTVIPDARRFAGMVDRTVVNMFAEDNALTLREALQTARRSPAGKRREFSSSFRRAKRTARGAGQQYWTWFDDSEIPAVQEGMFKRAERGKIFIVDYKQPPADVIDMLDLPLEIHEHQKVAWQNTSEMPIDLEAGAPGAGDETGTPPPEEKPQPEDEGQEPQPGDERTEALSAQALAKMWQNWRASWRGLESPMRGRLVRHLRALRDETLKNLERSFAAPRQIVKRDLLGEVMFDVVKAESGLAISLGPLMREAVRLGGQQALDETAAAEGKETPDRFNMQDPEAVAALRRRSVRISDISRKTAERLRNSLADGLVAGEDREQLAERVRKVFTVDAGRAKLIAFQEVSTAVEASRQVGREQAKVPFKSWLWSRKETGRPWHGATEQITMAEPVATDQLFTLAQTGRQCMHPRGTGAAEDDINCGCTTISRYPGDAIKELRMLRHLRAKGFTTHEALAARNVAADTDKDVRHDTGNA